MAKEKYDLDNGSTVLIFSTDDGCTRWWRWLHQFRRVIFDKHTVVSLQTIMHIDCMILVKCDTCKVFSAYAQLARIRTSIVGNVGTRHRMQVTHSKKERIFRLFHSQLKTNSWIIWHHKLKLLLSAKIKLSSRNGNQCRTVCQIWGHAFHNARKPSIWPVLPIQNWTKVTLWTPKIPRLPRSMDHNTAPK